MALATNNLPRAGLDVPKYRALWPSKLPTLPDSLVGPGSNARTLCRTAAEQNSNAIPARCSTRNSTVLYGSTRLDARNCQFIGSSQASRSCRRRRAEMSNRRWAETCGARCRPHSHPGHGWTMEPWASLDCALAVSTSQNRPGLSPIQSSRCKAREPLTNSRERPFESVV